MAQIKAFLFDLDGVIVDTAKYHYIAWRRLAQELGLDLTEAENEALKGVSRMQTLDIILQKGNLQDQYTEAEKVALATRKNDWYRDYILKMDEGEILPGVTDFLQLLKAEGYRIGLGSASKNAPTILDVVGLTDYFEVIVDGSQVTHSKPHPETFLKGAEALGVLPSETIVFEDSQKGIQAAKAGGFTAIGIGDPHTLQQADRVLPGLHAAVLAELVA